MGSLLGTVRCQPVGVRKCQSINSTFSIISRPFVAFLAFGSQVLTLRFWITGIEGPCCPLGSPRKQLFPKLRPRKGRKNHGSQIWPQVSKRCSGSDARIQAWQAEKRTLGKKSEESKTSH